MSKKLILGYTRAGHAVLLPTHRSPAPGELDDWTRGDHSDAAGILREHGEREQDPELGSWCRRWAKEHKLQKSARPVTIRGAAEISIKVRRPPQGG